MSDDSSTRPRRRGYGAAIASAVVLLVAIMVTGCAQGNASPATGNTSVASSAAASPATTPSTAASPQQAPQATPTAAEPIDQLPEPTHQATSTSFAAYTGTWYQPQGGLTLVMAPDGIGTFTWPGYKFIVRFMPGNTSLDGTVTYASYESGFNLGGHLTLKRLADGGLVTNTASSDGDSEPYYQAKPMGAYAGTWTAHSTYLIVKSNGTGQFEYRDYTNCPVPNPADEIMCNTTINFTLFVTPKNAVAKITSSYAELSDGEAPGKPESSRIPNGTTFTLALQGNTDLMKGDMTGLTYGDGTFTLCRLSSLTAAQVCKS